MVAAPNSTSDAIRNAAPGCGSHASGPTEMEYTAPKNSGDSTPAIAPTLLLAPCSWPCSDSDTRRVISDWMVGIASPHSALGSMASVNSSPVGARPMQALRSEEHTSELQSLLRISYAVF